MTVSGTYIPADTYVTYINNSSRLLMNKASTNVGTTNTIVPLTFGGVTNTTWQSIDSVELQQDATITVDAANGPGTVLSVGTITGPGDLTKAGDGTLALSGTNTYSGATLIQAGMIKLVAPITVTNHSFEVHDPLNEHPPYGFFDNPNNAIWTFYSAGIAEQGSTWVSIDAVIDGGDVAFIQANSATGRVSTTISLPDEGLYAISFMAGKRPTTRATEIWVEIDGTNQFMFAESEFKLQGDIYSGSVHLSSGSHTLAFKGVVIGVDRATWIDRVTVTSLADGSLVDTLPTGTAVTVDSGAVLDLGGNTQTLAGLSGDGLVTNGTLAVSGTVAPGGSNQIGTLTLATTITLNGTLLIDTSLAGACDLLKVGGPLNLTGSTLQIQDLNELQSGTSYLIATCTPGGLTGPFDSTNIDSSNRWHVVYDNIAGEVRLEINGGTLIIIY